MKQTHVFAVLAVVGSTGACAAGETANVANATPAQFTAGPSDSVVRSNHRAKRMVIQTPAQDTVVHISDEIFFSAVDAAHPGMGPIVEMSEQGNQRAAWAALDAWLRTGLQAVGELRDVATYRSRYGGDRPGGADQRADAICDHVIRVWHTQVVDFGPDMGWTNVEGRSSLAGFHFWGWSSPLWRAYLQTGNQKYAASFDDLLSSWYSQRANVSAAYPVDFIWYELGCGARVTPLIKLYYAMLDSASLRPETRVLVLKTLLGHANQLQAQQACGYTNGNFQLTASKALYQLGLAFPFFRDARMWRETATLRLLEHAYWDFDADGGHDERCVGYGSISLRAIRQLLIYAEDDPAPSPLIGRLRRKVTQMQLWFLKYVSPNGVFLGVNDSSNRRNESLLVDLATFAEDGRFLWPIRDSGRVPDGIEPREPEFLSVHMPASGWTVMRDGWERDSLYLLANWGKYGGGHTHPALLDVNMLAFGEPMVVETARFGSYDNPMEPYFRSPEAHNMVSLVDCAFERKTHQGENIVWRSDRLADYFAGNHRAYADSAGKVVERQVLFIKGEYWLVIDTVADAGGERAKEAPETVTAVLNWHATRPWRTTEWGLASGNDGSPGVQLVVLPQADPQCDTAYEGVKEEMYGNRYRAHWDRPTSDRTQFVTLVLPYRERPVPCSLEAQGAEGDVRVLRVVLPDRVDHIALGGDRDGEHSAGVLDTDARIAWLRETPRSLFVIDGSHLVFRGETVLRAPARQPVISR